ncbi:MAG: hypothetical protein ACK2UY_15875, partial [Anaerolineae bacterium]
MTRLHTRPPGRVGSLWVAMLAVGLAAALSACGGQAAAPGPTPTSPTPTVTVPVEMPVVISLVGFFDDQTLALLDSQIAAFEA